MEILKVNSGCYHNPVQERKFAFALEEGVRLYMVGKVRVKPDGTSDHICENCFREPNVCAIQRQAGTVSKDGQS